MSSSLPASLQIRIKIQLRCGDEIAMGPGKADLLDAIAAHGSISAAGRAMGMSYRRAWLLVDAMNRCWREPLVETSPGSANAGARVTPFGQAIRDHYRLLQQHLTSASAGDSREALTRAIRATPRPAKGTSPPPSTAPAP